VEEKKQIAKAPREESFLRFNGLSDPEFKFLASDIEGEVPAEYREDFMRPFVEMMGESERQESKEGPEAEELDMHSVSESRIVHDELLQYEMKRVIENTERSRQDLRKEVADIGVDALASLSKLLKDEKVSAKVRFSDREVAFG